MSYEVRQALRWLAFRWSIGSSSTVEDIRTFRRWSATTTRLIQESQLRVGQDWKVRSTEKEEDRLLADICNAIEPYRTSTATSLSKPLYDILGDAIDLDEKISEQFPQFEWIFPQPGTETFNPQTMQLEDGEETPSREAAAVPNIVICPGITKRGRSTGEELEKVVLLLRMKISCAFPVGERPRWLDVVLDLRDRMLTFSSRLIFILLR